MKQLEKSMDEYLVKKAPFQIPESGRKLLVEWFPWLSLIFGLFALFAAKGLWDLANSGAVELGNALNEYSRSLGIDTGVNTIDYGTLFYVAMFALVLQGVLMIGAFPGLRARSKSRGWNLVLFSVVANFLYGIFYIFTDSGTLGNLLGSVIGVVISLYLLAQIKSHYKDSSAHTAKK